MNLEARAENNSFAAREVDLGPKASAFVRYAGWVHYTARKEGIMELIEDPTFLSLFAQVQVMDAVLMASLKSHPRPAELLEHIEQNIALVRSVSALRAADGPIGKLADETMAPQADGWLSYARNVLTED